MVEGLIRLFIGSVWFYAKRTCEIRVIKRPKQCCHSYPNDSFGLGANE